MKFSSYVVLSTLVVAGIVSHAYVTHEQFYPAVVYLSTDKICLAIMYNFAFMLFLLFGKGMLRLFIGSLRDLEIEQLVDSGRGFLADTILFLVFYAPTIDNKEVGTVQLIQYICCVIFLKVFHLTAQIRVSHMFEVGVPRLIVNVKLVTLMCMLLAIDVLALQYFYNVASRSSTFFTWILFEALTMCAVVIVSICKYSVHMVDLRLDNGWPGKSACLFYIDLMHDVMAMTLFLVFMLTFFVQNPSRLPIYMMADVIQVARKLAQRLRSFRRYRRISANMDARFLDPTDAEIEANEHCVICRDSLFEGSKPKKLPCGHIFHIDCLRSWLVMQQVCPTCRAEISADAPLPTPPLVALAQQAAAPIMAGVPPGGVNPQPAQATAPSASQPAAQVPSAAGTPAQEKARKFWEEANSNGAPPTAATSAPLAGAAASSASPDAIPRAFSPAAAVAAALASASGSSGSSGERAPATIGVVSHSVTCGAASVFGAPGTGAVGGVASLAQLIAGAQGGAGVLPPMQEINDALQRARDLQVFMQQQTEFWMEQVREIQRVRTVGGAQFGVGSAAVSSASGTIGAIAPITIAAVNSTSGPIGSVVDAAAQEVPCSSADASPLSAAGDSSDPLDQLAELRRSQKEQWEKKRSSETMP